MVHSDIAKSQNDAIRDVEKFIDDLFGNVVGGTGATQTRQVSKHFIIAASGSVQFTTVRDSWLRKIVSDTGQFAVTLNGFTYTQLAAIAAPAQLFSGVLVYSNATPVDNMNVFIPAGQKVTVSVSSSGTQRMVLFFDEEFT